MAIRPETWTISTEINLIALIESERFWSYGDEFWGGFAYAPGTPYTIVWGGLAQLPTHASARSSAIHHIQAIVGRLEDGPRDVYGVPLQAHTVEGLRELLEHLQQQ